MNVASGTAVPLPVESGFLSREWTIARLGFNRWLPPAAALSTHLCIGMAYSVSWLPLTRALDITWATTGLPITWGIWITLSKATVLFH